jgi:hypothetical protein
VARSRKRSSAKRRPRIQQRPKSGASKWRSEWDALLGSATDRELARRLRVSAALVLQRRHAKGIEPHRRWSDAARGRLEKCRVAAERRERVRKVAARGTVTRDQIAALAQELGVTEMRVRQLVLELQRAGERAR